MDPDECHGSPSVMVKNLFESFDFDQDLDDDEHMFCLIVL